MNIILKHGWLTKIRNKWDSFLSKILFTNIFAKKFILAFVVLGKFKSNGGSWKVLKKVKWWFLIQIKISNFIIVTDIKVE